VEHDTANRIAVAVVLYRHALRMLIPAARAHPHPPTRLQLTQVAKQYLSRAEELRNRLDEQSRSPSLDMYQSLALQLTVAAVSRDQAASAALTSSPPTAKYAFYFTFPASLTLSSLVSLCISTNEREGACVGKYLFVCVCDRVSEIA
jgi:MIT (microtubule interacting and transport) domain